MSDNTVQFRLMVTIHGGLDVLYRNDPHVFVASDLLWYPVEGDNKTRQAPDVMVAFGRPKGDRGSYRQWEEANVAPQVTFEILSPSNRPDELIRKFLFYDRFGVEEYYLYNPDSNGLFGWHRNGKSLEEIPDVTTWVSPRLGIRFDLSSGELRILGPDGIPFPTFVELAIQRDQILLEKGQILLEKNQVLLEKDQIQREREQVQQEADEARQKAERLAAQLRALGVEPQP